MNVLPDALFSAVLAMSLTGSGLWLILRLARPLTGRLCTARWEKGTRMAVLAAYLCPVGLLLRPLLSPAPVLTVPAALSPYGSPASLPPMWALTAQDAKPGPRFPVAAVLAGVWLAGALIMIFVLAARQRRFLRRLRRTALPVEDEAVLDLLASLCAALRLSRVPPLYTSERIRTPLGAGLLKPALYLPETELEPGELAFILRHELVHLKRRDLWFKWLALAALALHWFDPLAWRFVRECGHLCETACDEAVIADLDQGGRRHYGCAILEVLYRAAPPESGVCAPFCARTTELELRLRRILRPARGRMGQAVCTLTATVLLAAALPLASAVHAWAEPYVGRDSTGDYQVNLSRTALAYLPFGVTYDAGEDLFRYRGEVLSAFIDTAEPTVEERKQFPDFTAIWKCGWYHAGDASGPTYRTVRDKEGRLVGIEPLTAEARDRFLEESASSVCFNGYCRADGPDGTLFATDPPWDTLPHSIQDWAMAVPDGVAAVQTDDSGGYLCYGGLYCPWVLKYAGADLGVYFYTIEGSDPTRPCVIRYTVKTPPEQITFYINDIAASH